LITENQSVTIRDEQFKDQFGRVFDYLRISVIENCNLRCIYCMPESGISFAPSGELMQKDEIQRILRLVVRAGVKKVRFTGGEPLLRKDLPEIIEESVRLKGIDSVHLTTNGLLLHEKIDDLKKAGLHGINISLDTLNAAKFVQITRRDGLQLVLDNLVRAIDRGFESVKINMVVLRKFNDDELYQFAEMTRYKPVTVRFIELMPFDAHQIWKTGHFMGVELMIQQFKEMYPDLNADSGSYTEKYVYKIQGYKGKIALIPSYTRSLCDSCNRIRMTANGQIRNCLYSEHEYDILGLLRKGATDNELMAVFRKAIREKTRDGWESQHQMGDRHRESMTQIGG